MLKSKTISISMEKELEVEVKIISKEMIKPSLPPPSHPKIFTLSLFDQIYCIFYNPVLLFYTANVPIQHGGVDVSSLKTSLSQTLDQFYPLSGRLLDESTISYNHQGIPFTETNVNCHLSDVLSSPHKLKLLKKFLPPQEFYDLIPLQEKVPLAFQINVFLCGGVVIGGLMFHKLLDGASLGTFLKHWSALASKRFEDLVQPDFEATLNAFPPLPSTKHFSRLDMFAEIPPPPINSISLIKSFVFDTVSINKLRARATSELIPKPTGFEAVAGFLWEQSFATARNFGAQVEHTTLSIAVNMRQRMSPPLPRGSIGNIITETQAQAATDTIIRKGSVHQELVKEIRSALSKKYQKISCTNYQAEDAAENLWLERKAELRRFLGREEGIYIVTSWCNIGVNEADFGFGKPVWIVPFGDSQSPSSMGNVLVLTDYCHPTTGDYGIEAWMWLEENEMRNLECNKEFLAFASPN